MNKENFLKIFQDFADNIKLRVIKKSDINSVVTSANDNPVNSKAVSNFIEDYFNNRNDPHVVTNVVGTGSCGFNRMGNVGDRSAAFNFECTASGINSFATGQNSVASGSNSFSQGYMSIAPSGNSHAEGFRTEASGASSHAEGTGDNSVTRITVSGVSYSLYGSMAKGAGSHAEGFKTFAGGHQSHAEGNLTQTTGEGSHAEGSYTSAIGRCSHAEGSGATASGDYSHAEGINTIASSVYSHAEGNVTEATAYAAHSEGGYTHAKGEYSHTEGIDTITEKVCAHAEGRNTIAKNYASHVMGMYNNRNMTNTAYDGAPVGDVFVIGNGKSVSNASNAFRVTYAGQVYGLQSFNSSGADYAEYIYEWGDGNPDAEDRVGYFVTFKDKKIYKASSNDYILGIISGNPSIVGNSDEDYYWRYERDEFNRIIYEDVEEKVEKKDANGNTILDKIKNEPVYEKTGNIIKNAVMKVSDKYDNMKTYISRSDRKEWDYVGLYGVLPLRDDGTCIPGQYCKCGADGIATLAEPQEATTNRFTYMVLERVTDSVVKIIK